MGGSYQGGIKAVPLIRGKMRESYQGGMECHLIGGRWRDIFIRGEKECSYQGGMEGILIMWVNGRVYLQR